jgi:hypothetical protein
MAAGILSIPGTQFGPCADACHHSDCASTRMIAESVCRFCDKEIGFDTRFYNDNGYVHASCLEDAIEQERSTTHI